MSKDAKTVCAFTMYTTYLEFEHIVYVCVYIVPEKDRWSITISSAKYCPIPSNFLILSLSRPGVMNMSEVRRGSSKPDPSHKWCSQKPANLIVEENQAKHIQELCHYCSQLNDQNPPGPTTCSSSTTIKSYLEVRIHTNLKCLNLWRISDTPILGYWETRSPPKKMKTPESQRILFLADRE